MPTLKPTFQDRFLLQRQMHEDRKFEMALEKDRCLIEERDRRDSEISELQKGQKVLEQGQSMVFNALNSLIREIKDMKEKMPVI